MYEKYDAERVLRKISNNTIQPWIIIRLLNPSKMHRVANLWQNYLCYYWNETEKCQRFFIAKYLILIREKKYIEM